MKHIGMTLVELLVVIAIMGTLLGLSLPAIHRVRASSYKVLCENNLRQIGVALQHYHDQNHALPSGISIDGGKSPMPFLGWTARLLPFLENSVVWDAIIDAFNKDKDFRHNPPHIHRSIVISSFTCPADGRTLTAHVKFRVAFTAFLGVNGTDTAKKDGVLFLDSRVKFADVQDGLSNTVVVGERPPSANEVYGWWYAGWGQNQDGSGEMILGVREMNTSLGDACEPGPYHFRPGILSNQCDMLRFWSTHPSGAHFLFGDGAVKFLSYGIDSILPALATRAGSEAVGVPD